MRLLGSWKSMLVVVGVVALLSHVAQAGVSPPPVQLTARVDGLTCPFCAYGIEKRVKRLEVVASYHIEIKRGEVSLVAKPGRDIPPERVRRAIADAGFSPRGMSLIATGTFGTWDGRTAFTLAGVEPAVRYVVSGESRAPRIEEAAKAGDSVRATGRLLPVGDKAARYEIAIDRLDTSAD